MNDSMEFHKVWIEQCTATEDICEQFGCKSALDYLVDEKLFNFLAAAEQDPAFAAEVPAFIAEIRRLFTAQELRDYLDQLARSKYFSEAEREPDDLLGVDDEPVEEPWPDHPVLGAQELLLLPRSRTPSTISVHMATLNTGLGKTGVPLAVCQIKIVLLGTRPPIWRRVLVPADFTLGELHGVIQAAMGWGDEHLHEFRIGGMRFGVPDPNDALMGGTPCINEENAQIANVLNKRGPKPRYIYDFGDGWEHALAVEKIRIEAPEACVTYPLCTAGKRNCPPEDCGGIPGFYHKLEVLSDPNHEEHEELREWMGDFDPETFSIEAANQKLHKMFRASRRRKPVETAQPKSATANIETLYAQLEAVQPRLQLPHKQPQRIRPGEKVPLELNDRERTLILEHTFADEELTDRLRVVPKLGERPVFRFTLDDLDELAGFVAAEANHAKDKKLGKELDRLFARIDDVLESYTDQD